MKAGSKFTLKDENYLGEEKKNPAGAENRKKDSTICPSSQQRMTTYLLPGPGWESGDSVTSPNPQKAHSPDLALEKS